MICRDIFLFFWFFEHIQEWVPNVLSALLWGLAAPDFSMELKEPALWVSGDRFVQVCWNFPGFSIATDSQAMQSRIGWGHWYLPRTPP